MGFYERQQNNKWFQDYFARVKDKVLGSSTKYIDSINKMHLPQGDDVGLNLLNFIHESLHHIFSISSIYQQSIDLLKVGDFLINYFDNFDKLPHDAKYDFIKFSADMLSGKELKNKRLVNAYGYFYMLYQRSSFLRASSSVTSEGVATYCSTNIQASKHGSVLDYMYNKIVSPHFRATFESAQQRIRDRILSLPMDNNYKQGYQKAEKIAQKHGIDAVISIAMLAYNVPFYNYDLLHDHDVFEERGQYLFNVDARWDYLISLDEELQHDIISSIEEEEDMELVLGLVNRQELRERRFDFTHLEMYYLYYLILHRKTVDTVSRIYKSDMTSYVEDLIRPNIQVANENLVEEYFYGYCNNSNLKRYLEKDDSFQLLAEDIISVNHRSVRRSNEIVTQVTEEDIKRMIDRQGYVESFKMIMERMSR